MFQRDARVLRAQRWKQAGQRRTMGYFIHRKFELPEVQEELRKYGFENGNYSKVIVTWVWTPEAKEVVDDALLPFREEVNSRQQTAGTHSASSPQPTLTGVITQNLKTH